MPCVRRTHVEVVGGGGGLLRAVGGLLALRQGQLVGVLVLARVHVVGARVGVLEGSAHTQQTDQAGPSKPRARQAVLSTPV